MVVIEDINGKRIKVDGHTRVWMHKTGALKMPELVTMIVYRFNGDPADLVAESKRLYDSHDSRSAAKTPKDEIQSSLCELEMTFESAFLGKGAWSNGMKHAALFISTAPKGTGLPVKQKRIAFFDKELKLLDQIEPSEARLKTSAFAAALMILREYGALAVPMLQQFNDGTGLLMNEDFTKLNALARVKKLISDRSLAKKMAGDANNKMMTAEIYELFELAIKNNTVGAKITAFNAAAYNARIH